MLAGCGGADSGGSEEGFVGVYTVHEDVMLQEELAQIRAGSSGSQRKVDLAYGRLSGLERDAVLQEAMDHIQAERFAFQLHEDGSYTFEWYRLYGPSNPSMLESRLLGRWERRGDGVRFWGGRVDATQFRNEEVVSAPVRAYWEGDTLRVKFDGFAEIAPPFPFRKMAPGEYEQIVDRFASAWPHSRNYYTAAPPPAPALQTTRELLNKVLEGRKPLKAMSKEDRTEWLRYYQEEILPRVVQGVNTPLQEEGILRFRLSQMRFLRGETEDPPGHDLPHWERVHHSDPVVVITASDVTIGATSTLAVAIGATSTLAVDSNLPSRPYHMFALATQTQGAPAPSDDYPGFVAWAEAHAVPAAWDLTFHNFAGTLDADGHSSAPHVTVPDDFDLAGDRFWLKVVVLPASESSPDSDVSSDQAAREGRRSEENAEKIAHLVASRDFEIEIKSEVDSER